MTGHIFYTGGGTWPGFHDEVEDATDGLFTPAPCLYRNFERLMPPEAHRPPPRVGLGLPPLSTSPSER